MVHAGTGVQADTRVIDKVRQSAFPVTGAEADYDHLLDMVGDARVVMIGEASHGTHEFYNQRAEITKRLSHYLDARLSDQFDAYIHIDQTHALEPLDRTSTWDKEETPETFPLGQ